MIKIRRQQQVVKTARRGIQLAIQLFAESLEERAVPATFTVANLNDSGIGSLRQALLDANSTPGADVVDFTVAGVIQLTSAPLPTLTDEVQIDGTSAPGFVNSPVVELDGNGLAGLVFGTGSANSMLMSMGIVNAVGSGITLSSTDTLIAGNFIGLELDGLTEAGNGGDGITLTSTALRDTIGGTAADDRNVISGNLANGIAIDGSSANTILANYIGTDATGTLIRGNGNSGVLLINGASNNTIGGTTSSATQFSGIAPDGNLISGNDGDGILVTLGANTNTIAANFIGTDLAGTAPLGNTMDGVAITNGANSNSLLGTFVNLQPFIFYNVISGNGGNGLRVSDSNNTTIQANFFGMGADNNSAVDNGLNGVLIEGTSANTTMGGVIPLGNVAAANGENGVVLQDTASGFISFNTFAGVAAFTQVTTFGNALDGFLITSTGGNNLLRTNVISENGTNGVELAGEASGVQIVQNIIGLDTAGSLAMGNVGNGIQIGGDAHDNVIGGPQPTASVIPINAISGNGGDGIAVVGTAHDNFINFSHIGTNLAGTAAIPNAKDGVSLGQGTTATTIGAMDASLPTVISGNTGNGLELLSTSGNTIIGSLIGVALDGVTALANGGDGILVTTSSNNVIGGTATGAGNVIAFNTGNGILLASGAGNAIMQNSIFANVMLGIDQALGANDNQVPPFLTSAVLFADGLRVSGTLTSTASTSFTIEFFADLASDPSGFGEGRSFLGSLAVRTDSTGYADFAFLAALPPTGSKIISATATDAANGTSAFARSDDLASYLVKATGASLDGGQLALFPTTFAGEIRTLVADFNGDGVPDLAAATGPGSLSSVIILDGATGSQLFSITPFGTAFTGGLFIAAGDLTGDGIADLAITAGLGGGPRVRLFRGGDFAQINDFFGIADTNFRGGTSAAIGDVNGDGIGDLIIAAGAGGGPRIAVYDGKTIADAQPARLVRDFFAFDPSLRTGVYVAAGDINGDGKADLIFTPGSGGGPLVNIVDGAKLMNPNATFTTDGLALSADLITFFARNTGDRGGLRVAVRNLDGDGMADIVTSSDSGQGTDRVAFLGRELTAGTVTPRLSIDDPFAIYSNAIFVD